MDWIKGVREIVPWLAGLSMLPKAIISALIVGAAAFALVLIWTPPPETAVKAVLADCYRRALFTQMHAQLNADAMFKSIDACRQVLQTKIPEIHRKDLQSTAVELLAAVEQIERRNPIKGPDDVHAINNFKVAALHAFRMLAAATNGRYALSERGKLGEATFFTPEEADAPLSPNDLRTQLVINDLGS